MPLVIRQVNCFGTDRNPDEEAGTSQQKLIKTTRVLPTRVANARFGKVKVNALKISGVELNLWNSVGIDGLGLKIEVIEVELIEAHTLFVWCIAYDDDQFSNAEGADGLISQLTITISTSENPENEVRGYVTVSVETED